MGVKKYEMPNGKTVAFEYDEYRIGKITLETMDRLMEMVGAKEKWDSDIRDIWGYDEDEEAE